MGIYSSNKPTSFLAIFVFACPLKPKKLISCLDKIALSKSGITVSWYPCISEKTSLPSFLIEIKLSLISSFIDLEIQFDFFNSPNVLIFK